MKKLQPHITFDNLLEQSNCQSTLLKMGMKFMLRGIVPHEKNNKYDRAPRRNVLRARGRDVMLPQPLKLNKNYC